MAYTHYFRRAPELNVTAFLKAGHDVRLIIDAVEEMGIKIAGPTGEGHPQISKNLIAFNGELDCGHRYKELGYAWPGPESKGVALGAPVVIGTKGSIGAILESRSCGGSCAGRLPMGQFSIDRVFIKREWDELDEHGYFQFCETDFKPYDLAVMAALIRLKERHGNAILLSSDGSEELWEEGKKLCRELFGHGSRFVLEPLENLD